MRRADEPQALTFCISTVWFIIPHLQAQLSSKALIWASVFPKGNLIRWVSCCWCLLCSCIFLWCWAELVAQWTPTGAERRTSPAGCRAGLVLSACPQAFLGHPKTLPCVLQLWGPQGRVTKLNQALIFTGAQVLRGLSCSVVLNLPNFEVMYIESSNKKREPYRTLGTFVRSHQPPAGLRALAASLCPWHFLVVTVYVHWAAFSSGPDSLIFWMISFGWAR